MVKIVSLAHPMNIFDFCWQTKKLQIFMKFWPFSGLFSAGPRSISNKPRPKVFDYKGCIWYPLGRVKLALKSISIDSPYYISPCIPSAGEALAQENYIYSRRNVKWIFASQVDLSISLSFLNRNYWNLISRHIFWRCLDTQNFSSLSLVLSELWNF